MVRVILMLSWAVLLGVATTSIAELPIETMPSNGRQRNRLREGTELQDALGTFRLTGDRATFILADGSARFGGLENLSLERVANVIAGDPSPLEWIVSGVVTEYKGNNFLLVTKAILKTKASGADRPAGRMRHSK
jgi:hypothetical protein